MNEGMKEMVIKLIIVNMDWLHGSKRTYDLIRRFKFKFELNLLLNGDRR